MSRPRILLPLLIACLGWWTGSARGARPWVPQRSVRPYEAFPVDKRPLRPEIQKRFAAALAEGQKLLERGQYRKAQPVLAKAVRLDPDHIGARQAHARALLTLGYLHWNRALVVQALDDVRHALWLQPDTPSLIELAILLDQLIVRMDRLAGHRSQPGKVKPAPAVEPEGGPTSAPPAATKPGSPSRPAPRAPGV